MEDETRGLLEDEIKRGIQDMGALEPGSREYSTAVDNLATLYNLKIEETKNELNYYGIAEAHEREERTKQAQLEEQKKERYFKYGVEAGGTILLLAFNWIWMRRGFKFEENGTFTSTTFRGLFSGFKPKKK